MLQSMGLQRVGHNLVTDLTDYTLHCIVYIHYMTTIHSYPAK